MAKRRRKIKRPAPAWKSAIGFSAGVHALIIFCVVGFGWRYLTDLVPGTVVTIHEVMLGESDSGRHGVGSQNNDIIKPTPPKTGQGLRRDVGVGNQPMENSPGQAAPTAGEGPSPSLTASEGLGQALNSVGTSGQGTETSGGAGDPTLAEIRRRIEKSKRYPVLARNQHIEGKVGVQFLIETNGQVQNIHITRSSGSPLLDEAAVQAVQHSAPLPYYGNAIHLSLAFRLR